MTSPTDGPAGDAAPAAQAPAASLPGDDHRTQLPERVVTYWRCVSGFWWLLLTGGVASVVLTAPDLPTAARAALLALPVAALLVDLALVAPLRRRIWWYAIGDEQIDLQHGWLIVTRTAIPMTRVQHVQLERGPLAARFNLAELKIHTAAGHVTIPALDRQEGDRIRQRIAELARIADDL